MLSVESPGAETGARTSTWRLPIELLLHCLMATDMVTRIRASHVCRTWREAALAQRRLWDNFSCSDFRDKLHKDAMFSLLESMLLRSRPLPFYLSIPNTHGAIDFHYQQRLLALKAFDVRRLAAYHGPALIFQRLNPSRRPLPHFVCLDVLGPDEGEPYGAATWMEEQLDAHCLPNLQQLSAPSVRFPADGASFLALRDVTFACMQGLHHRALFAHCPSLVRMDVADSTMGTPLPDPPVPASLREVSIRCALPRALDVTELLRHWRGVRVPRLTVGETYSLQGVLPLFLASHAQKIELRLPGGGEDVVLAATPEDESVWTLSPSPPWASDFLASIEKPTSERLTSISVAFSRLGALLCAQLHTPGLETLELRLDDGADTDRPSLRSDEESFLRAPRLRSVFFNMVDDSAELLENQLAILSKSFRTLLIYDAEILDAIVVSRHAERICAGFGPFAEEFVVQ